MQERHSANPLANWQKTTAARRLKRRMLPALAISLLAAGISLPLAAEVPLPALGGSSGGLLSAQMESEIGEEFLIWIRKSAPIIRDPLLSDYLRNTIYRLVPNTPLESPQLKFVLIDDPSINAFAVPGGIIGINGGLLLHATTEHQFASVLAHELAHLSQRHFARRLEQQAASTPLALAGLLAGIAIAATSGSDAGLATIVGTQAALMQNSLSYSRNNEQEADRIGIEILAASGMNPRAMPAMFDMMLKQSRLQGTRLPEYLSTHPITESRVSDSRSRAEQYPAGLFRDSTEYHLMRARMLVHYADSPANAIKQFTTLMHSGDPGYQPIATYGAAVAHLANKDPAAALPLLESLLGSQPSRITLVVTHAQTLMALKRYENAIAELNTHLARNPDNYPLMRTLASALLESGDGNAAARMLERLTKQYPYNHLLWNDLAEAQGQVRNIVEIHRARAEYLLLLGDPEAAELQLREALEKIRSDLPLAEVIRERLKQTEELVRKRRPF